MSKQSHPHGEQLSAYIDGMLDVGKTRSIAEHLRVCAACRTAMEHLQETKALLHQMPLPARQGDEFWTGAYRRLRVDEQDRTIMRQPLWDAWRRPDQVAHRRWAAGLAAVAAVVALMASPLTSPQREARLNTTNTTALLVQPQDISPDVSSLVESHTDSVSRLPLADPDRQKMIAVDAQQTPPEAPEAAGYADIAF